MFKKYGLPAIITLLLACVYYYFALPVINFKSASFWGFLLFIAICYFVLMGLFKGTGFKKFLSGVKPEITDGHITFNPKKFSGKKAKIIVFSVVGAVVLIGGAIFVTSSPLFNAAKYQKMLTVTESNFNEDIAELPLSQIPVVDRDTAARLGSRKIGEVVELVSQFNVSDYYTQINYQNMPTRVSPLEYADIIKWFTNNDKGIPYYVKIDMASQDTELVELKEGIK